MVILIVTQFTHSVERSDDEITVIYTRIHTYRMNIYRAHRGNLYMNIYRAHRRNLYMNIYRAHRRNLYMKGSPRLREAVQACDRLGKAVKIMEEVNHDTLMFYIHQTTLQ